MRRPMGGILFLGVASFYLLFSLGGACAQDWPPMRGQSQSGGNFNQQFQPLLLAVRDSMGVALQGAEATIADLWLEKADHNGIVRIDPRPGMRYPLSIVVKAPGHESRYLLLADSRRDNLEVNLPKLQSNPPPAETRISVAELSGENQANSLDLQQEAIQALQQGENRRAEELLRRAIEISPSVAMIHNNLGVAILRQGRLKEAATWFESAHELAPYQPVSNGNLGLVRWMQGRGDESYPYLARAVKLGFSTPSAHYYLGILALARAQWERSAEQFSRINSDRFRHKDLFLALALRGLGREKEASKSFQQHNSRNPVHYYAYTWRRLQRPSSTLPAEKLASTSASGDIHR